MDDVENARHLLVSAVCGYSSQIPQQSNYLIEVSENHPRLGTLQLSLDAKFLQSVE